MKSNNNALDPMEVMYPYEISKEFRSLRQQESNKKLSSIKSLGLNKK